VDADRVTSSDAVMLQLFNDLNARQNYHLQANPRGFSPNLTATFSLCGLSNAQEPFPSPF
jgi:hypothetical protein